MVFVNYYDELEVSQAADLETIQKSIKEKRRRYRSLTGSPNLDQRSMAERKMQLLAEAEKIFTDPNSRSAYDVELSNAHQENKDTEANRFDQANFVERARAAFAAGNLRLAAQYAKEATNVDSYNVDAWKLRATIAQERGLLDEVEMACSMALDIDAHSPEILGLMGDVYLSQKRYQLAKESYEKAFQYSRNPYWKEKQADTLYYGGNKKGSAQLLLELANNIANVPVKVSVLEKAAAQYAEIKDETQVKKIYETILELDPSLSNKMQYAANCLLGEEMIAYLENLLEEYGHSENLTTLYGTVLLATADAFATLDNKQSVEKVGEILGKIKKYNVVLPLEFQPLLQTLEDSYAYASNRQFAKSGCSTLFFLWLFGYVPYWMAGKGFKGLVIGLLFASIYILQYAYPYGWKLNQRRKKK
ncbi:hypothetical protein ABPH35_04850 [Streptococcus sp. ZJ93]|uniref:hypothetical protein n=1 Tax=Streptococcus handemini TaxID=3161188 RepID=UPI0032EE882F